MCTKLGTTQVEVRMDFSVANFSFQDFKTRVKTRILIRFVLFEALLVGNTDFETKCLLIA